MEGDPSQEADKGTVKGKLWKVAEDVGGLIASGGLGRGESPPVEPSDEESSSGEAASA